MEGRARVGITESHGRKERALRLASRAWFGGFGLVVVIKILHPAEHEKGKVGAEADAQDPIAIKAVAEDEWNSYQASDNQKPSKQLAAELDSEPNPESQNADRNGKREPLRRPRDRVEDRTAESK